MRTHVEHREQLAWLDPKRLEACLHADALAVLRCEPVVRAGVDSLVVDLTLTAPDGVACVPLIFVDLPALLRRSAPALVWPAQIGSPDRVALAGLEQRIEAQLDALMYGRTLESEAIVVVDERARAAFEAARADGALGAASRAVAQRRLAPAIEAARWARDRRVALRSSAGAHFAAVFAAVSDRVALDPAPLADPATLRWYGCAPAALENAGSCEVAFVDVSLSPPAAPVVVWLSDTGPIAEGAAEPPSRPLLPAAPATGGSAGRIAFFVRPGATWSPDADTDEAQGLARALAREGFTTRVTSDPAAIAAFAPDVVHLVGLEHPASGAAAVTAARQHGAAVVVSPLFDDPASEGWWGCVAAAAVASAVDETERSLATHLLTQRTLAADGWPAARRFASPATDGAVAAIVRAADAVLAQTAEEAAAIRAAWNLAATVVGSAAEIAARPEPLAAVTGSDPVILVHAPVRPAANLVPVVLGADRVRAPLVLAGPVLDAGYAERLRALGGAGLMFVDDSSPGVVAALYAVARVYVDVAWAGRGEARVTLARRCGAAVVRERRRGERPGIVAVDRADAASVGARIGDAWLSSPPPAETEVPLAAMRAILGAYARAARQPVT